MLSWLGRPCRELRQPASYHAASEINCIWFVETENAFSNRRAILESTLAGQIVQRQARYIIRNDVSLQTGFLKISQDPVGGSLFYHDLKIFQGEARHMVHTRCPGTFIRKRFLSMKFLKKHEKITKSLKIIENQGN